MTNRFSLLPEGLRDTLPPLADAEARVLRTLIDHLACHGYERVNPPLAEFEHSLDGPVSGAHVPDHFRFMDPVSGRTLAVRSDITGQVARIASSRLAHWARPLRLSYSGSVLRVKGTQFNADRQFMQVGAELIGSDAPNAIAEVISVAVNALKAAGLTGLRVDITLPDFLENLLKSNGIEGKVADSIRDSFDAKDSAGLASLHLPDVFNSILSVVGSARKAIRQLQNLSLPEACEHSVAITNGLIDILESHLSDIDLSLDPCERRGFEYQTTIGFSIFAKSVRGEVGRGGTYVIHGSSGTSEIAVGFSLYVNGLIEAGHGLQHPKRLLVPAHLAEDIMSGLHNQGWVTVSDLGAQSQSETAISQRCDHIWCDGTIRTCKDYFGA